MDKLAASDLSKILSFAGQKRKVTLKDLHKSGIFLAEKLGDIAHLSMYFRIVKYEYPEFVTQAFSYAMASYTSSKAAVFLKRLATLKQQNKLRLFIGIFPKGHETKIITDLLGKIEQKVLQKCKIVLPENLHLTLFFHANFPAIKYAWLVRLVGEMREKYGEEVVLTPTVLRSKISKNLNYIWLEKFNSIVFRYYYGMFKLVRENKRLSKQLKEFFANKRTSFYPHITLARCKEKLEEINLPVDIAFEGEFKLAVSKLTNKGPKYKIHATY